MSTTTLTYVASKCTKAFVRAFMTDPVTTITVAACVAVPATVVYGIYTLIKK